MNRITFLLLAVMLIVASCGASRKGLTDADQLPGLGPVEVVAEEEAPPVTEPEPIREVEEKLVPVDDKPVDPHRYFVIIGSFRYPDNARQHQTDIREDGFSSEILRNEEGLYRVSVMATNDVSAARAEIMRIRNRFPKYNDTWLLISRQQ